MKIVKRSYVISDEDFTRLFKDLKSGDTTIIDGHHVLIWNFFSYCYGDPGGYVGITAYNVGNLDNKSIAEVYLYLKNTLGILEMSSFEYSVQTI